MLGNNQGERPQQPQNEVDPRPKSELPEESAGMDTSAETKLQSGAIAAREPKATGWDGYELTAKGKSKPAHKTAIEGGMT